MSPQELGWAEEGREGGPEPLLEGQLHALQQATCVQDATPESLVCAIGFGLCALESGTPLPHTLSYSENSSLHQSDALPGVQNPCDARSSHGQRVKWQNEPAWPFRELGLWADQVSLQSWGSGQWEAAPCK